MTLAQQNMHFPTVSLSVRSGNTPRFSPASLALTYKRYLNATTEVLCETLWPTRCVVCDRPGTLLCEPCRLNLHYIDYWRSCPRCGGPNGLIQCSECNPVILADLSRATLPFTNCVSAVLFDSATARLIRAFKDSNERGLAAIMATLIINTIPPAWYNSRPLPTICFIPSTKKAYARRGFDHCELLATQVGHLSKLKVEALLARPHNKDQRELTRKDRITNMANRFDVQAEIIPPKVLLIDDVYTTGSTLCAASDALLQKGARQVFCATFARVW